MAQLSEDILALVTPKTYMPGEILFRQGESADEFFYLESGLTQAFSLASDGRERIIMTTWPQKTLAAGVFLRREKHRANEMVMRKSVIYTFPRPLAEKLMAENAEFRSAVMDDMAFDVIVLCEQLADSALLDPQIKLSRFLCRRIRYGQCEKTAFGYELECTQEFIGKALGLSRATVNQALSALASHGWLELKYGRITITDYAAVSEFAYKD